MNECFKKKASFNELRELFIAHQRSPVCIISYVYAIICLISVSLNREVKGPHLHCTSPSISIAPAIWTYASWPWRLFNARDNCRTPRDLRSVWAAVGVGSKPTHCGWFPGTGGLWNWNWWSSKHSATQWQQPFALGTNKLFSLWGHYHYITARPHTHICVCVHVQWRWRGVPGGFN